MNTLATRGMAGTVSQLVMRGMWPPPAAAVVEPPQIPTTTTTGDGRTGSGGGSGGGYATRLLPPPVRRHRFRCGLVIHHADRGAITAKLRIRHALKDSATFRLLLTAIRRAQWHVPVTLRHTAPARRTIRLIIERAVPITYAEIALLALLNDDDDDE